MLPGQARERGGPVVELALLLAPVPVLAPAAGRLSRALVPALAPVPVRVQAPVLAAGAAAEHSFAQEEFAGKEVARSWPGQVPESEEGFEAQALSSWPWDDLPSAN